MKHVPRKRFGQHFLHDPAVIDRIVRAINIQKSDYVVEVGPGEGVLTAKIAPLCDALQAIEIDRDLAASLQTRFSVESGVVIHVGDALTVDICSLSEKAKKLRLVGNLPYNVSTPLLFHFLRHLGCVQDMHFMLQKEVVDRMVAKPGGKQYGRLSIAIQMLCEVESLFDIGPGAFRPPPKVWSSIVRLRPRPEPLISEDQFPLLERLGQRLFSQRRKTLRKILQGAIGTEQLEALGIDPTRRPETLSLSEIKNLLETIPGDVI